MLTFTPANTKIIDRSISKGIHKVCLFHGPVKNTVQMCYTTSQNSSVWSLFNTIPTYCNGQTCPLRAPYVWCMRARHTFWLEGERAGRGATKQQMDENEFQADHGKVKPSVTVACTELHNEIPTQLKLEVVSCV